MTWEVVSKKVEERDAVTQHHIPNEILITLCWSFFFLLRLHDLWKLNTENRFSLWGLS